MQTASAVGKPIDRVDGRVKVTGAARYSTDAPARPQGAGTAHAVVISSTIARGRVTAIDTASATAAPGVLAVLTHENRPPIKPPTPNFMTGGVPAESRLPLADSTIHYAGQHVAVVIARTLEQARHAAALVKVRYEVEKPVLSIDDPSAKVVEPPDFFGERLQDSRGDVDSALADPSAVKISKTYTTPPETHNPMEVSNTTAVWDEGDRLTVYDSTQWISGTQAVLADAMGVPRGNVRVICPFVGGGFGCKGFIWPHTLLAAAAARAVPVGTPVKLVLSRAQQFVSCGHRPPTRQEMTLSAAPDGRLTAARHATSLWGQPLTTFLEPCAMGTTRLVYAVPNVEYRHRMTLADVASPTFMRAPGEAPGSFALECAMDELAEALQVDPVELRLRNLPKDKAPHTGLPWSSYHLDACLRTAAEKFGWARRNPTPGAMREGRLMIGQGMAVATFPAIKFGGACKLRWYGDGNVVLSIAAHDLGTGAYTVFTQATAHELGLPVERVRVEMGDSALPPGPLAGGSNSTATVTHIIHNAAVAMKKKLIDLARQDDASPLKGLKADELVVADGFVTAQNEPARREAVSELTKRTGKVFVEADGFVMPGPQQHAFHSFGAQFVEVAIDPLDPLVRVRRVVSMFDAGRILNPKTARSQFVGGIVWGISMALNEETHWDSRSGRVVNDNLADYAMPVNADIRSIDVNWTDIPDPHFNPLGVRGIGEIGITGVAAAIANAVYHATGRRVRDLPITPDKLL